MSRNWVKVFSFSPKSTSHPRLHCSSSALPNISHEKIFLNLLQNIKKIKKSTKTARCFHVSYLQTTGWRQKQVFFSKKYFDLIYLGPSQYPRGELKANPFPIRILECKLL